MAIYSTLSAFRVNGFNGPEAISPRMIIDWCEATGTRLYKEEIAILFEMDAAFRNAWTVESEARAAAAKAEYASKKGK